jgi:hypothetical protein
MKRLSMVSIFVSCLTRVMCDPYGEWGVQLLSRRIFQTAPRLGRRAAYLVRIYSYASAASIWGGKVEVVSACPF